MNRFARVLLVVFSLLAAVSLAMIARAQGKKNVSSEEFFIVSAVDVSKSQLLLKRPTEVTLLMFTSERTQFLEENGKTLKLSDFRAGDTVWVISTAAAEGKQLALRIRKGPMTLADLHRLYLDLPPRH
jgi:hypothetical protein